MAPSAPPVYLIKGPNLLEAALVNLPDVIDFGLHGPQITSAQFVGVHCVGSGVVVESPKPSSRHQGVSDLLMGFLGTWKAPQERNLSSSLEDLRNNVIPPDFPQQNTSYKLASDLKRSGRSSDPPNRGPGYHLDHNENQYQREEQYRREEFYEPGSPPHANLYEGNVHTWELVWKEGKAGGQLRRLKFATTESGYQLIQNKLDAWISASHTSMAMNEAAKAALDACGGHLKENPVHPRDSAADHFVPLKGIDGAAVEHTNQRVRGCGLESHALGDTLEGENYLHVQYVIDLPSVQLQGNIHPRCDTPSSMLKDDHVMAIAAVLPIRFRTYNWTLLYSTYRDGISLNTLYRKVHENGPTILVVRDFQKKVFGCYTSEEWKVAGRSYGTGECFVFQVVPEMKAYKWTRTNNMFMFSNLDVLAIGGGDHYSILLNSDLLTGYSGACETFGSPLLASSEDFDVSSVEVWGFQ